jgi:hypothetical protein
VEVTRGILLVSRVRLVGPVDADFLESSFDQHLGQAGTEGGDKTNRLVNATAVQCLQSAFGSTRVIVLNEAIVVTLLLWRDVSCSIRTVHTTSKMLRGKLQYFWATHVLIRDDLHILYVTSSLEDLTKNILRNARVESTDVKRPLVRFGSHTAGESTRAVWGHHTALIAGHGGGNSRRDRVRVLRNVQRRRRHVSRVGLAILAAFEARSARVGLRRRRQLSRSLSVLGHGVGVASS